MISFWKKCVHEWHHLHDDDVATSAGGVIDFEDGCWIFCPRCKKEDLVSRDKWFRIKKKQQILKEYQDKS